MAALDILPPETLTPSCRDSAELADQIGVLVSKAIGHEVKITSMRLGMGKTTEAEEVAINWKRNRHERT